jgi:hypothetical protein
MVTMSPFEFQRFKIYRELRAMGKSTVEIATAILGQPCTESDFSITDSAAQLCTDQLQLLELKYALHAKWTGKSIE